MLLSLVKHTLNLPVFRTEQVALILLPDFPIHKVSLTCLCVATWPLFCAPWLLRQRQNLSFISLDRVEVDWIFKTTLPNTCRKQKGNLDDVEAFFWKKFTEYCFFDPGSWHLRYLPCNSNGTYPAFLLFWCPDGHSMVMPLATTTRELSSWPRYQ